ncbi:inosine guanosine and xanthosine phosphorylase family [Alkaliphilus metalliredigens QYMF]|uniref:Purine nucleoside phosphorylase n=1 Tax=Alkaliphilus metalliredigens (strain QYMF) TaxID=293826 RepID=A6TR60_ALKMQ|nr:purine-nucleoside phosphorylase [Alkaliphilus metalliredigens]ABR48678.1 inosine guanosine and xanthosine phosphorylase family [Alkaliphilus metalliredigens QYMF]
MENSYQQINESIQYIKSRIKNNPQIGLILGSGLGVLAEEIKNPEVIAYQDIPNFPVSTVEGHAGELVMGEIEDKYVIAMKGRFHFYEGYSMKMVTFPVRVMIALGIENLIVTNAAGGANYDFTPGDLMIITDHINFSFDNPLIGINDERFGVRFPDLSNAYDEGLIDIAKNAAVDLDMNIQNGVYAFMTGPTYETPAEVRMMRILGADAVGMSTVPEITVAAHGGVKALGISCITNMAAGILDQPLNHDEVMETAAKTRDNFVNYIKRIIETI